MIEVQISSDETDPITTGGRIEKKPFAKAQEVFGRIRRRKAALAFALGAAVGVATGLAVDSETDNPPARSAASESVSLRPSEVARVVRFTETLMALDHEIDWAPGVTARVMMENGHVCQVDNPIIEPGYPTNAAADKIAVVIGRAPGPAGNGSDMQVALGFAEGNGGVQDIAFTDSDGQPVDSSRLHTISTPLGVDQNRPAFQAEGDSPIFSAVGRVADGCFS